MDIYNEDEKCDFYFERTSDKTLSTQSPILKAVFYALSRHYNQYVVFDDIANEALALLENEDKEAIVAEMNSNLLKLILSGHVKIRLDKPAANFTVGVYPKAWEYAKAQSSELDQDNVTNLFMEGMGLNPFEKYMIRYLDGKSTKEEILDKIMIHVRNKELDVNYFDKKVISENRIRCVLSLAYIDAIERFAENALLV
jgi:methyltransferase-like protein